MRLLSIVVSVAIASSAATAQERLHLKRTAFGFHPNSCGDGIVQTFPPSKEILRDTQWLSAAVGLNDVAIREADIRRNACAVIDQNTGKRYILFGRFIAADGDPEEKWALDFVVLAHEVGHLACGHGGYSNNAQENWSKELAADRFSGKLIRRMVDYGNVTKSYAEGFLLKFVVDVMARGEEYTGGRTHPPNSMRRQAVREGFYDARGC